MLRDVSLYLANHKYAVSVVGRTTAKMEQLMKESPPNRMFPIQEDYDKESFLEKVEESIEQRGMFDLIISWTPNYRLVERLCFLNENKTLFRLIHIKGSRRYFQDETIEIPLSCMREIVYLGFIQEENTSRWLTHEEISQGVMRQIEDGGVGRIVGQLHPYDSRPE
ncbi:hypothetical protein [Sporosarcina sp. Te-1]|uniref:hypothetical protein n=1 Tax=Sporosarcina sp. Te-1 TaxID=2818390 RepID=UPI001A9CD5E6|nr:hypothetical protein [Sporosarcina sp. Te-1]QTD42571.1 hypothetical protein J3U78_07135 [Sporosarcina sp. Te-1]